MRVPRRLLLLLLILAAGRAGGGEPDGEEVMRRVNGREAGRQVRMRLHMTVVDERRGTTREDDLELIRRRTAAGYRSRFAVLAPPNIAGLMLLLVEEGPAARLWMHFPSTGDTTEVATRALSVLGSDFSFEDLRQTFPMGDYTFTSLGREVVGGHACWKIEMRPRGEEQQRAVGFGRAVGWVREDALLIVQAEFFDRWGQLFKRFESEQPARVGGIWTLQRYRMINPRARHRTEIAVTAVDYDRAVDPALLDPATLGK